MKELIEQPKRIFVVIDDMGMPCQTATWPEACHEHINDAINDHDLMEAAKWKVREYVPADALEQQAAKEQEDSFLIDKLSKLLAAVDITLNGEELPLQRRTFHDIPEQVQTLHLENELRKFHESEFEAQTKTIVEASESLMKENERQEICIAELEAQLAAKGEPVDIKQLVDRFLGWKLPENFAPDCGIRFDSRKVDALGYGRTWPTGTNLFTADQAREMFEYMLNTTLQAAPVMQGESLSETYVQTVPDKCDRIVWRNTYYHLPRVETVMRELSDEELDDIWRSLYGNGYQVASRSDTKNYARACIAASRTAGQDKRDAGDEEKLHDITRMYQALVSRYATLDEQYWELRRLATKLRHAVAATYPFDSKEIYELVREADVFFKSGTTIDAAMRQAGEQKGGE